MAERRRLLLPLILTAGLGIAATGGGRADAAADAGYGAGFSGTASGNGMRMTFDVPNSAARNPIDGGGPTAQAHVDSLGNSTAFASHPYPGEIPLSGPGLLTGSLKGSFPMLDVPAVPGYPFYVESKHPLAPHGEMTGPGQTLDAASDALSSSSKAISGFGSASGSGGFARSVATVESTAETVTAQAESRVSSFAVGPFRLGEVVSTARAVLRSDGSVDRDGQISVTGAAVEGVPVKVDASGLTVADSTTPLPSGEPVAKALEQAHLTVEITPKEITGTTVVAPAVKIVQTFPGDNGRITYLVGVAAAALEGDALSRVATGAVDQNPAPAPTVGSTEVVMAPVPAFVPDSPLPVALGGPAPIGAEFTTDAIAPAVTGATQPLRDAPAPEPARAPIAVAVPSAATKGQPLFDTSGLSLAVLAAGVVGVVISQLQRLLGVTPKGKESS
ncbi:MAG: hypothetical protein AB1679_07020 [Actinomycetota bacterium]